jgi:hypothetical protein
MAMASKDICPSYLTAIMGAFLEKNICIWRIQRAFAPFWILDLGFWIGKQRLG